MQCIARGIFNGEQDGSNCQEIDQNSLLVYIWTTESLVSDTDQVHSL